MLLCGLQNEFSTIVYLGKWVFLLILPHAVVDLATTVR